MLVSRIGPSEMGLFISRADGSEERPLIKSEGLDYDRAWSPDGQWIVFTSERGGSADLYRVKPDGSNLERLTHHPTYDDQAAFSPDIEQIVFVTPRAGGTADLWTPDPRTHESQPLPSRPAAPLLPP